MRCSPMFSETFPKVFPNTFLEAFPKAFSEALSKTFTQSIPRSFSQDIIQSIPSPRPFPRLSLNHSQSIPRWVSPVQLLRHSPKHSPKDIIEMDRFRKNRKKLPSVKLKQNIHANNSINCNTTIDSDNWIRIKKII